MNHDRFAIRQIGPLPALPLALLMRQLAAVIEDLDDAQYSLKPVGVVQSSIGAHVRHCLDHVVALLRGLETGAMNYDDRQRGTAAESSRAAALEVISRTQRRLAHVGASDLDRPVDLWLALAVGQEPMHVPSTIGRELAYVVSHTIHHHALIGAMVTTLGGRVPLRFGYAPSTVAHLERQLLPSTSA